MSIHQSAFNLLEQLRGVITQLTPNQFTQPIATLSGSSLGQHIRHTLEFFICLQDAHITGVINYDNRNHDKYLQEDVKLASKVTASLQENMLKQPADFNLIMEANYEMDSEENLQIPTSYHRELAYNIEHAIHHMALIKVGIITAFPHIELPAHFGVASSTVRFQNRQHVK